MNIFSTAWERVTDWLCGRVRIKITPESFALALLISTGIDSLPDGTIVPVPKGMEKDVMEFLLCHQRYYRGGTMVVPKSLVDWLEKRTPDELKQAQDAVFGFRHGMIYGKTCVVEVV